MEMAVKLEAAREMGLALRMALNLVMDLALNLAEMMAAR